MRAWRLVLTIGAVPALLGAAVAVTAMQQSSPEVVNVQLPTHWVPYQADFIRYTPEGEEIRRKQYRAPDGSLATYDEQTGAAMIHNLKVGRTFIGSRQTNEWVSRPLSENIGRLTPLQYGVRKEAYKVASETIQGLEVLELTGSSGSLTFFVPGLNNLALRAFDPKGKLLAEYRNVSLAIPDDNLFSPPPDAQIRVESAPARKPKDGLHQ